MAKHFIFSMIPKMKDGDWVGFCNRIIRDPEKVTPFPEEVTCIRCNLNLEKNRKAILNGKSEIDKQLKF